MADLVVTIAKDIWVTWLAEGDLPGEEATEEWALYFGSGRGRPPPSPKRAAPGDRVYVVAHGFLRGYAPLLRVQATPQGFALVRGGGAVACTLLDADGKPRGIAGFQGVRYAPWGREHVAPFPAWQTHGLPPALVDQVLRLGVARATAAGRAEMQRRALRRATLF